MRVIVVIHDPLEQREVIASGDGCEILRATPKKEAVFLRDLLARPRTIDAECVEQIPEERRLP